MKKLKIRRTPQILLTLFILAFVWNCKTTKQTWKDENLKVSYNNMMKHINAIAHDSMQGRYSGSKGQLKTANYIADYFKSSGVKAYDKNNSSGSNVYFNDFNFLIYETFNITVTKDDKKHKNFEQIILLEEGYKDNKELPLVLVESITSAEKVTAIENKIIVLHATDDYEDQVQALKELGASTVFLLTKDANFYNKQLGKYRMKVLTTMPFIINGTAQPETGNFTPFLIAPDLSNQLLQNMNDTVIVNSIPYQKISTQNVVGSIKGQNPDAPALVISAHYDHEGVQDSGEIFNGADDNASGVAVVLETARLFASQGKKPYRDIIFTLFSGEEQGIRGSKHFVSTVENPKKSFFANINIDMIGRRDDKQSKEIDYIYPVTDTISFSHLKSKIDRTNRFKEPALSVDYSYSENTHDPNSIDINNLLRRSDYWPFMNNDIPSVGFFSGFHKDYHKTTDTADKIDLPLLQKRAALIYLVAKELGNQEDVPSDI